MLYGLRFRKNPYPSPLPRLSVASAQDNLVKGDVLRFRQGGGEALWPGSDMAALSEIFVERDEFLEFVGILL